MDGGRWNRRDGPGVDEEAFPGCARRRRWRLLLSLQYRAYVARRMQSRVRRAKAGGPGFFFPGVRSRLRRTAPP